MLDDFREWLSDNLRYILLGLAVLLTLIIVFCVVRLVTGASSKTPKAPEPQAEEAVTEAVPGGDEEVTVGTPEPVVSASDLSKDDAEVLTLIRKYYNAVAAKDTQTLSLIVQPWDDSVEQTMSNDIIESYNNISTYSKQGLEEGSYVVYAYFEGKIAGYETAVPSLSLLYLITDGTGNLVVSSDHDSDEDVSDYITSVSSDADVQALISDVNRQYENALSSDENLKNYLSSLEQPAPETEEAEAEPTERLMTSLGNLNIRSEPSTSASILGGVYTGDQLTVLEETSDGWCRIRYNSAGTEIEGYVRLEYLKPAEEGV